MEVEPVLARLLSLIVITCLVLHGFSQSPYERSMSCRSTRNMDGSSVDGMASVLRAPNKVFPKSPGENPSDNRF